MCGKKQFLSIMTAFTVAVLISTASHSVRAAVSSIIEQPHIQVSLLSDVDVVRPGSVITVGLHLNPDKNWHVYWRNPGDSGMPPKITWDLPQGVSASEIHWPWPEKIPVEHLVNYGYHEEVVLPVQLAIGPGFSGESLQIKAASSWLVCEETCIPGSANLILSLPMGDTIPANEAKKISGFVKKHPSKLPLMDGSIKVDENNVTLELYSKKLAFKNAKHVEFFAVNENLIEYNQAPEIRWNNNFVSISQKKSASFGSLPEVTEGVLVIDHSSAWHFRLTNE